MNKRILVLGGAGEVGREVVRDIRAYAEADGNPIPIEAIAERVRSLFHRRVIPIQGYTLIIAEVTGPVTLDGGGYYGRVVKKVYP